jgi:PEP-CTERM motif
MKTIRQRPLAWGFAVLLSCLALVTVAQAAPVTLEFSGTIFSVVSGGVFVTTSPNTYSLFVTWDPDLLPGMPAGGFSTGTAYQSGPGETSITFSFLSGAGEFFASDNSFPVRIVVDNTPPLDPMMPPGTTGNDRLSIKGMFAPNLKLSLELQESPGKNPLSSNDLPTTAFGSGPGTWIVSELDIDRTDVFANISGSVANIKEVTTVPEPSTLALCSLGVLVLGARWGTRKLRRLRDMNVDRHR